MDEEQFKWTKKTLHLPDEIEYDNFCFNDFDLTVGLCHSNDSTIALHMLVIIRSKENHHGVTIQDGSISLYRRHTKALGGKNKSLKEAIDDGVKTLLIKASTIQSEINMLRNIKLNDRAAHHMMMEAAMDGIIPWSSLKHTQDRWEELEGTCAWDLYQAFSAVGFRYKKTGNDFVHPGLVTMVGADGKISRYLYGITFLPFDVKMALLEAAEGRTGPTINKVLLYCFSYDPSGKKYAFNFLKVTGTIILFLLLVFVVFLIFTSRARRKKVRTTNVG